MLRQAFKFNPAFQKNAFRYSSVTAYKRSDLHTPKPSHSIKFNDWKKDSFDVAYRQFIINNPFYHKGLAPTFEYFEACEFFFNKYICNVKNFEAINQQHVRDTKVDILGVKQDTSQEILQIRCRYESPLLKVMAVNPETHCMIPHIPEELKFGNFEIVLPLNSSSEKPPPICVQYAGTGDHGYKKRRLSIGIPLAKNHSIGSVIYENAYYGTRKPASQNRSALEYVSDLCIIGCTIGLETPIILKFLEEKLHLDKICLSGVSFGGHLACFSKCLTSRPNTAVVPCLSWSDSSVVWTDGLMRETIGYQEIEQVLKQDPRFEEKCYVDLKRKHPEMAAFDYKVSLDPNSKNYSEVLAKYSKTVETVRIFTSKFSGIQHINKPTQPELIRFVVAKDDGYYPQLDTIPAMEDIWPGIEMKVYEHMGHVEAYIRGDSLFCQNIADMVDKIDQNDPEKARLYQNSIQDLIDHGPAGDEDLWVDNKTKLIAFFDPIVMFGVLLVRKMFNLKDFAYRFRS